MRIATQTDRTDGQQINRQVSGIAGVADTVMQTSTTVEVIRCSAGDEGIVTRTTSEILDIDVGITLRVTAEADCTRCQQVDGEIRSITGVANAVMRGRGAGAAIKVIRRCAGDEEIVT